MAPGSGVKSEYMKRYQQPRWDELAPCYRELLHYRLGRRLLEQAHAPWLWDAWAPAGSSDAASSASSGAGSLGASPASPRPLPAEPAAPGTPEDPSAAAPARDTTQTGMGAPGSLGDPSPGWFSASGTAGPRPWRCCSRRALGLRKTGARPGRKKDDDSSRVLCDTVR